MVIYVGGLVLSKWDMEWYIVHPYLPKKSQSSGADDKDFHCLRAVEKAQPHIFKCFVLFDFEKLFYCLF